MGKEVLLTRPIEEAIKDRETFERFGFKVNLLPTIDFEPLDFEVPSLEDFDYVYFGSKRGIRFFLGRVGTLPSHLKVIAVGEKTARSLKEFGLEPFLVLKGSSDHLLELVKEKKLKAGKILIPTAESYLKKIHKLERFGFKLKVLPVYRTVFVNYPLEEVLEKLNRSEVVIFTSPSTFKGLLINLQNCKEFLKEKKIVAIGKTTEAAILKEGFKVWWKPTEPNIEVLARELAEVFNGI